MILIKSKSIIGIISKFIKFLLKAVYKILSFLNLQFSLFVAVLGVILWILGVFTNYPVLFTVFLILFAFSIVLSVAVTFKKIFWKKDGDKHEKNSKKVLENNNKENYESENSNIENQNKIETSINDAVKPKYYKVSQNENYVMAEYNDRYELYYKTEKGLKKVRTDYKR